MLFVISTAVSPHRLNQSTTMDDDTEAAARERRATEAQLVLRQKQAKKRQDEEDRHMLEILRLVAAVADDELTQAASRSRRPVVEHRHLPRGKRRKFRPQEAERCIRRDYIGPEPLFNGREFEEMFRISRPRFQRLTEDIGNANIQFYTSITDVVGTEGATMNARILLPLKTIAYGVAPHCFRDYFQMSKTFARQCCKVFDATIKLLYAAEYLRIPTSQDLIAITKLHKAIHGIDGLLGSLDCMHANWKNCPTGWQGSYKGKEGVPTIVLEAMADYHGWFHHVFFGSCGTLNDKSVLYLSHLFDAMTDGTLEAAEESVVPYRIGSEEFDKLFILVDGIYPPYSRFVKGITYPVTRREKKFTQWQEAVRKDIERAFGLLQGKFQCMARPFHQLSLDVLANRVGACLILHNMCVSDRVMDGDARAWYKPDNNVEQFSERLSFPRDLRVIQEESADGDFGTWTTNGIRSGNREDIIMLTRDDRVAALLDREENARLTFAIMDVTERMVIPGR